MGVWDIAWRVIALVLVLQLLFSFSVNNWWWKAKIGNVRRWVKGR